MGRESPLVIRSLKCPLFKRRRSFAHLADQQPYKRRLFPGAFRICKWPPMERHCLYVQKRLMVRLNLFLFKYGTMARYVWIKSSKATAQFAGLGKVSRSRCFQKGSIKPGSGFSRRKYSLNRCDRKDGRKSLRIGFRML